LRKLELLGTDFEDGETPVVDIEIISKFNSLRSYHSKYFHNGHIDAIILTNNHRTLNVIRINCSLGSEEFWGKTCLTYPVLKNFSFLTFCKNENTNVMSGHVHQLFGENYSLWFPQIEVLTTQSMLEVHHLSKPSKLTTFMVFINSTEELYQLMSYKHNKTWKRVYMCVGTPINVTSLLDLFIHFYDQPGVKWGLQGQLDGYDRFSDIQEYKSVLLSEIERNGIHNNQMVRLVREEICQHMTEDLEFLKQRHNISRLCPLQFFTNPIKDSMRMGVRGVSWVKKSL
jgi:hypothetical protein